LLKFTPACFNGLTNLVLEVALPQMIRSEDPLATIINLPPVGLSEALKEELLGLRTLPGWTSAAVTRRDGLAIQHTFGKQHQANSLCAMAAAVVGSARSTGEELKQGAFHYSIVQYGQGLLLVMEAGAEAILACLFARNANLGMALMKMTQISKRIEQRLQEL
jgi:predicted regulator of Ras-like GTPase activity (Roadblock/LC7/MglB family)